MAHRKRNMETQILSRLEHIKDFVDEFDPSTGNVASLKPRLKALEECWSGYDALPGISTDERNAFDDKYFDLVAQIETLIDNDKSSTSSHSTVNVPTFGFSMPPTVHLPAISLPKFKGDYEEWSTFKETFIALIHEKPGLSDIQKYHYLKSCLQGEAASVISSFQVSGDSYKAAWELLNKRFHNERVIVNRHIRKLFEEPSVTKSSGSGLRQLLNNVNKNLRALESLGQPTDNWDSMIVYLVSSKLDYTSRREWENSLTSTELPTWETLSEFLTRRCQALEAIEEDRPSKNLTDNSYRSTSQKTDNSKKYSSKLSSGINASSKQPFTCLATQKKLCPICSKTHPIYWCFTFKKLSITDRINEVKRLKLCLNCLNSEAHKLQDCKASNCKRCGNPHHTLLCEAPTTESMSSASRNPSEETNGQTTLNHVSNTKSWHEIVLLSTVQVNVIDAQGNIVIARALLDSGSQSNFISASLAQLLGLKQRKSSVLISGINSNESKTSSSMCATISSRSTSFKTSLEFLVIPKITQIYPPTNLRISSFEIPAALELADPHFYRPGQIDMLLGAEVFFKILSIGQISLPNGASLQKTCFGWVLAGKCSSTDKSTPAQEERLCHLSINEDSSQALADQIERFWALEHCYKPSRILTPEEKQAEEHFERTIRRDETGRFVITLPFKDDPSTIGSTRGIAERRLHQLLRRLHHNPNTKSKYIAFLKEYEDLGHMTKVSESTTNVTYHIPHHAVCKEDSPTTKLRVVFNASTKGPSGYSLNDLMIVGPVIQDDLFTILVRFRQHRYVLLGDIRMMYRMIRLSPDQQDLHRILWWDESSEQTQEYALTTLTYGTAPASFLATKCLDKLSKDVKDTLPLASQVLSRDFYMDDLVTGDDSRERLKCKQVEIIKALHSAGMHLHKWCSNDSSLLSDVPTSQHSSTSNVSFEETGFVKTLGLAWNPLKDAFVFTMSDLPTESRVTKRLILSEIARLFDPLGLVSPIIVKAKIVMQKLWEIKCGWDESLPANLHTEWVLLRSQLLELSHLHIPRSLIPQENPSLIELHGFSDASESAYGTCLYMRCIFLDGSITTQLICSKSRVAPIKLVTVPRLELCAAVLMVELLTKVKASLDLKIESCFLWTDSTVVLGWINSSSRLKTFVANRITQILEYTHPHEWRHVRSEYNPADCLSRGMAPAELKQFKLWWFGPPWLAQAESFWPGPWKSIPSQELPEIKSSTMTSSCVIQTNESFLSKFSNFYTLLRVTAWCLRFVRNCQQPNAKNTGLLSPKEVDQALMKWVKLVQKESFAAELKALSNGEDLHRKSKLRQLHPFLDPSGLLRVGGRLARSKSLRYDQKHPLILPSGHPFVTLLTRAEHLMLLHAGPQSLLASLRRRYWPLRGKNLVRKCCHDCVVCFKNNPREANQLMGDLPPHRVEPARPFLRTGVDFCGPMFVHPGIRRNSRLVKCYVSLFVCFSTKAVHLELVSDLTTGSFLAALRRFIGRRGKPSHIYSDNATNFIGSKTQLRELYDLFNNDSHINALSKFCTTEQMISWNTIPARSPHHGGLWESYIKLAKFHLKRIAGNANLCIEEFNTILVQVEACLNSRPLTPLSTNPNDLSPITPGHFLIGESLTTIPEPDMQPLKLNTLSRWQLVQRLSQNFWQRWSGEYLSSLQTRAKWKSANPNLLVGTLVLLKEENLPPLRWRLGRITELHKGKDGLVRIVSLRTSSGITNRSITKVCPLPIPVDDARNGG